MIYKPDIRRSLLRIVRSFFAPKHTVVWVVMAAYIYAEIKLLSVIGIWNASHVKDTLWWTATVAVVTLFQVASRDRHTTFGDVVKKNFEATLILDFLLNYYAFSLWFEIIFIPATALLAAVLALVSVRDEHEILRRPLNNVAALVGLGLVVHFIYKSQGEFDKFASLSTLKSLLVPLELTLLLVPFLYLSVVFAAYENLFVRLRFLLPDVDLRRHVARQILLRCNLRLGSLERCSRQIASWPITSRSDVAGFFKGLASARSPAPLGFRGLTWGSGPNPTMRLISGPTIDSISMFGLIEGYPPEAFLGLPVDEEVYSLTNGKFYSGSLWIDGKGNFGEISKRLAREYGPPSFVNTRRDHMKWEWPQENVTISVQFQAEFERSTVGFGNDAI